MARKVEKKHVTFPAWYLMWYKCYYSTAEGYSRGGFQVHLDSSNESGKDFIVKILQQSNNKCAISSYLTVLNFCLWEKYFLMQKYQQLKLSWIQGFLGFSNLRCMFQVR